jgi:hypothetical protein
MKKIFGTQLILPLLVSLSGCAVIKAATFRGDDATSHKIDGSQVTLQTFFQADPAACVNGPPQGQQERFIPAAIAVGIATVAISAIENSVDTYLANKQKEFTYQYGANANQPYYYARSASSFAPYTVISVNCIRLTRYIKEGDQPNYPAFIWTASMEPTSSGSGLEIKTRQLRLARAGALTDEKTRKVDISVEVKIDATTINDNGQGVTTNVADKTLAYQGVQTPGQTASAVSDWPMPHLIETSWFPAIPRGQKEITQCNALPIDSCGGVSAINIGVQVTETGSGATTFADATKQFDDNKSSVNSAVTSLINSALTPQTSAGSSKPTPQ